jgi:hypothetical protein
MSVVLFVNTVIVWLAGCANTYRDEATRPVPVGLSPLPLIAPPAEAWRIANAYAADRVGAEVVLGLGDSMAPFYPNRTLLVIEKRPVESLAPGMTVLFIDDRGARVAHTLVRCVHGEWETQGLGNMYRDPNRMTRANFIGCVTQAIELTWPRNAMDFRTDELRMPTERQPLQNLITATP